MINWATMNHRSRRDPQIALRTHLRELAACRVRFGYRRLTVMLRREGWPIKCQTSLSAVHRRRAGGAHQAAKEDRARARLPAQAAARPNEKCSMDFVAARLLDAAGSKC